MLLRTCNQMTHPHRTPRAADESYRKLARVCLNIRQPISSATTTSCLWNSRVAYIAIYVDRCLHFVCCQCLSRSLRSEGTQLNFFSLLFDITTAEIAVGRASESRAYLEHRTQHAFLHWRGQPAPIESAGLRLQCPVRAAVLLHHSIRIVYSDIVMADAFPNAEAHRSQCSDFPAHQIGTLSPWNYSVSTFWLNCCRALSLRMSDSNCHFSSWSRWDLSMWLACS